MSEQEKQAKTTSTTIEETSEMAENQGENKNLEQEEAVLEQNLEEQKELTEVEESSNSAKDEAETQPGETEKVIEAPEIEALQQEIVVLKEKLEQQIQKSETMEAQSARIMADFENFRKRNLKEKEILEQQVKRNTISDLLQVVDNFERARTQIKPANDGEMAIHKSYQGVYKNLVDSLKRIGVAAMRPEGQPFDPNYHEAMMREATDEYPEGTVMEQLVRGYLLGDQVLRHAMVKVAAPPESVVSSEEENSEVEQEQDNQLS